MAGTSARSKASLPRPAMTERGWPGHLLVVITGLVPVIHAFYLADKVRTWMAGTSPAMTSGNAKNVEGRDISAKQSFVASPGHDGERMAGSSTCGHHRACPGDPRLLFG